MKTGSRAIKKEYIRSSSNSWPAVCSPRLLQTLCMNYEPSILPRDASAERGDATVSRLSVCPSVRP